MIEGELPSLYKTGSPERGIKGSQAGGLVRGVVTDTVREFTKAFVKDITPPEIHEVLFSERQKKPEVAFVPVNQERPVTRPNINSRPSPMAAPVGYAERMDRMQSQARINEILRELR